jgi:hypothetical protein
MIDKARDDYEHGRDRQALKALREALSKALRRDDLDTIRAVRALAVSVAASTKSFSDRLELAEVIRRADKALPATEAEDETPLTSATEGARRELS